MGILARGDQLVQEQERETGKVAITTNDLAIAKLQVSKHGPYYYAY